MRVKTIALMSTLVMVTGIASAQTQQADQPVRDEQESYRSYAAKEGSLDTQAVEDLEREVMVHCGVSANAKKWPWYYHYELGLRLQERGDPQRALDSLVQATMRRERSRRRARMYGMWYTGYLPYFQIAKLHYQLGNYSCAADALRISESYREIREGDEQAEELRALREKLANDPGSLLKEGAG